MGQDKRVAQRRPHKHLLLLVLAFIQNTQLPADLAPGAEPSGAAEACPPQAPPPLRAHVGPPSRSRARLFLTDARRLLQTDGTTYGRPSGAEAGEWPAPFRTSSQVLCGL